MLFFPIMYLTYLELKWFLSSEEYIKLAVRKEMGRLINQLLTDSKFCKVKIVYIPKESGGERKLSIPSTMLYLLDNFLYQSLYVYVEPSIKLNQDLFGILNRITSSTKFILGQDDYWLPFLHSLSITALKDASALNVEDELVKFLLSPKQTSKTSFHIITFDIRKAFDSITIDETKVKKILDSGVINPFYKEFIRELLSIFYK